MTFYQAESCFIRYNDAGEGLEATPSSKINQIIFTNPLSTLYETQWRFNDPNDNNKVFIATFKGVTNFEEEFFQATSDGTLYHLETKIFHWTTWPTQLSHTKPQLC